MIRTIIAAASLVLFCCLGAPPSLAQYHGEEPWCAVINLGDGEVSWECYYRTVEECTPNVLAGNRGFCGMNPYYTPPAGTVSPAHRSYHHRTRQN